MSHSVFNVSVVHNFSLHEVYPIDEDLPETKGLKRLRIDEVPINCERQATYFCCVVTDNFKTLL